MKKILSKNKAGGLVVSTLKTVHYWNSLFSLSQHRDKFFLDVRDKKGKASVYMIPKEQADVIIKKARLLKIQSSIFNNVQTYRRECDILAEIEHRKDQKNDLEMQVRELNSLIAELQDAINEKYNK